MPGGVKHWRAELLPFLHHLTFMHEHNIGTLCSARQHNLTNLLPLVFIPCLHSHPS